MTIKPKGKVARQSTGVQKNYQYQSSVTKKTKSTEDITYDHSQHEKEQEEKEKEEEEKELLKSKIHAQSSCPGVCCRRLLQSSPQTRIQTIRDAS